MNQRADDSVEVEAPLAGPPTTPDDSPVSNNTEGNRLEKILPEIKELAQKVGGFGNLADIAKQLDQTGK
jgi:hypothetical protein